MEITSRIVEIAAWGVSLATHSKNYGSYQDELIKLITPDNIMSVKSIEKNYKNATPSGVVVETKDYILVSFRGTELVNLWEVFHDSQLHRRRVKFGKESHLIHSGFITEYEESKESLKKALSETSPDKPIIFSGHSLGGAMANIAALDFATNKVMGDREVGGVITFGAPRVLSHRAASLYTRLGLSEKSVRVVQKGDPIPELAPFSLFKHTGKEVLINEPKGPIHTSRAYRKIAGRIQPHHIEGARMVDRFERYLAKILTMVRDKILLFVGSISQKEYGMRERIRKEREFKEMFPMHKKS